MQQPTHIYHHTFSDGTKGTARLSEDPIRFQVELDGPLPPALFWEYRQWRRIILDEFSARTGKRILVVDVA